MFSFLANFRNWAAQAEPREPVGRPRYVQIGLPSGFSDILGAMDGLTGFGLGGQFTGWKKKKKRRVGLEKNTSESSAFWETRTA